MDYKFGFNGQEKVNEIAGIGNHTTALFWEYDTRIAQRWNRDPKPNPSISPYATFERNPIMYSDVQGDSVWLFATKLPGASSALKLATHTFIVVKTSDEKLHYYVYGPKDDNAPLGGSQLVRKSWGENSGGYDQDHRVYRGKDKENLKNVFLILPGDGKMDEFDRKVIDAAESFGNNPDITYSGITNSETTGNCNTSTTTILSKAGVDEKTIKKIDKKMKGINQGFGKSRPWTEDEQKDAVDRKKTDERIHKEYDSKHKD